MLSLHLAPGRVEVVARRQRGPHLVSRTWSTREIGRPSPSDLLEAGALLNDALRELRVRRGADAVLVYGYVTGRAVVSRGSTFSLASAAARTALLDELDDARGSMLLAAGPLCPLHDAAGDSHLGIAAGDADEAIDAFWEWAESAGLRPRACHVARAAELGLVVHRVTGHGADATRPTCIIGRRRTTLGAGSAGAVAYVRAIDIGIDSLTTAYVQAITAARFTGVDLPLRAEEGPEQLAEGLLEAHGIPERDEPLGATPLRGIDVLPLLQPVVQRLCGELRQTIRFGPRDVSATTAGLRLQLAAPVPNLREVLSSQLELPVNADSADTDAPARDALDYVLSDRCASPALIPRRVAEQRFERWTNRAATAGAAAATLGLAAVGVSSYAERRDLDARLALAAAEARERDAMVEAYETAATLAARLHTASGHFASALAVRPDWSAALAAIDAACGPGIELTAVDGAQSRGEFRLDITGLVTGDDLATPEQRLRRFITELSATGAVRDVELTSIDATAGAGPTTARFVVRAAPALRPAAPAELIATGGGP